MLFDYPMEDKLMKFMLLIYHEEAIWDALTDSERQEIYREYRELIQELEPKGIYLVGDELQSTKTSRTVRVREGKPMITDGPFAETREQLGGFFLIEAADADDASMVAARIPSARMGSIEVRPVAITG